MPTSEHGDEDGDAGDERHRHRLAHLVGADDHLPIDPDLDPDDPGEPSPAHRPAPQTRARRLHPATLAAIGMGGFVGACGRYELTVAWPSSPQAFPAATLVINTSGAFLLGLILTALVEHLRAPRLREHLRHFACVGVLGSWTTMSALAVDTDALVRNGHAWAAAAYIGATMVAGLVAVSIGIAIGRLGAGSRAVDGVPPPSAAQVPLR
jgi:fluoride exporter